MRIAHVNDPKLCAKPETCPSCRSFGVLVRKIKASYKGIAAMENGQWTVPAMDKAFRIVVYRPSHGRISIRVVFKAEGKGAAGKEAKPLVWHYPTLSAPIAWSMFSMAMSAAYAYIIDQSIAADESLATDELADRLEYISKRMAEYRVKYAETEMLCRAAGVRTTLAEAPRMFLGAEEADEGGQAAIKNRHVPPKTIVLRCYSS